MMKKRPWLFLILGVLSACQSVQDEIVKPNLLVRQNDAVGQNVTAAFVYKSYPVSVDYGRSLGEMVGDGQYDLINDNDFSAADFQLTGKGKEEAVLYLIPLGHSVTDDEAVRTLDWLGYRPAKIEHLLAFGAKYPTKQLESPIVALGTVLTDPLGRRYVSYLDRFEDRFMPPKRILYLFTEVQSGNQWNEGCRFLVVRKLAR